MWDNKCTEKNTYIGRRAETCKFIKSTTTKRRETMPIPIIFDKEWMDHYRKLLAEKRFEYRIIAQLHIQIEKEKINIRIEDVKKAIRFFSSNNV